MLEHRLDCGDDATRDLGDGTIAVDGNEATIVVEPLEQRSSLALEDVEAPLDHVGVVIGTARAVHLGRSTQVWEIRIEDERGKLVCISRLTLAVVPRQVVAS